MLGEAPPRIQRRAELEMGTVLTIEPQEHPKGNGDSGQGVMGPEGNAKKGSGKGFDQR